MKADLFPYRVEIGLWEQFVTSPRPKDLRTDKIAALFLDRDGVLNIDTGYVGDLETLQVQSQLAPLIRRANAEFHPVIIVTNQSGIGRGYYDWASFNAVNDQIRLLLSHHNAHIDAIYACAYHPSALDGYAVDSHPWRKPNSGMLLAASEKYGIDLSQSLLVGDRMSDIKAAKSAGLKRAILLSQDLEKMQTIEDAFGFSFLTTHLDRFDWDCNLTDPNILSGFV